VQSSILGYDTFVRPAIHDAIAPLSGGAMTLTIRMAESTDPISLAAVQASSIRTLCRSHYDATQLEPWVSRRTPELFERMLEHQELHVAEQNGQVVGYGQVDLESGQIVAVYVKPEAAHKGIGTALLEALEAQARFHGWPRVHLTTTLNALPFFEKHGYERVGPFDHEVANDVILPCVNMRKAFSKGPLDAHSSAERV
jgi:putative acetyltransferase